MARMIDADALINTLQKLFDKREKEQIFTGGRCADVTWNDAIYHIKSAPTIDAVPVVRCRDCRFYEEGLRYDGSKCMVCGIYPFPMSHSPNDYCSHGERKGGDE